MRKYGNNSRGWSALYNPSSTRIIIWSDQVFDQDNLDNVINRYIFGKELRTFTLFFWLNTTI